MSLSFKDRLETRTSLSSYLSLITAAYYCGFGRMCCYVMGPPQWALRPTVPLAHQHQDETVIFARRLPLSEPKFLHACINKRLSTTLSLSHTHTYIYMHTLLYQKRAMYSFTGSSHYYLSTVILRRDLQSWFISIILSKLKLLREDRRCVSW